MSLSRLDELQTEVEQEKQEKGVTSSHDLEQAWDELNHSDNGGSPPGNAHKGPLSDAMLSADHILTTEWPEPTWAIPELMPVGLAILAGRPKIGKSWLALQLTQAVATGGRIFNKSVKQGSVLFLALEDAPRRLNSRMREQSWQVGSGRADFLTMKKFREHIGNLDGNGTEMLVEQMRTVNYRLVVIDTVSRAIAGAGLDQLDSDDMTAMLSPLQETAQELNAVVLLIDHMNNQFTGDLASDIFGSVAKAGVPDTLMGLYRENGKASTDLRVEGRETEDLTLELRWDGLTKCWHCKGDANSLNMTDQRQQIVNAVKAMGRCKCKHLVEATGIDNRGWVYKQLQTLSNNPPYPIARDEDDNGVWYVAT